MKRRYFQRLKTEMRPTQQAKSTQQTEVRPAQRSGWWKRSVEIVEGINKWFTMLAGLAVIFLALPLIYYVYREVKTDVVIVDPISVPKQFEEAGITPQIMANHVGDKLQEIERSTQTHMKKDVLAASADESAIPEVEIPGTKLGLKTLVDVARSIFGLHPKHIGGDVVFFVKNSKDEAAPASARDPVTVTAYFVQEHVGRQSLSDTVKGEDLSLLVQALAELALQQINPYVLAYYKEDHKEFESARSIVEVMINDSALDKGHRMAALNLWGIVLDDEGKYEEAIVKLAKAVEVDPTYAYAYHNWGVVLSDEGKYEEAIVKYAKAVDVDPKFATAYNSWGNALNAEGKYEEATVKYATAVGVDPKFATAYNSWGNTLNAEGKHEEAIVKYAKAVEVDPKFATAYNNWGTLLNDEGKSEEAIVKFEKVVEIDPKNAYAYCGWGDALDDEGKYEEAIVKYAKAVEIDPKLVRAYANWGHALEGLGKRKEAEEKFAVARKFAE